MRSHNRDFSKVGWRVGRRRKLHCFTNNVVYRVFLVPAGGARTVCIHAALCEISGGKQHPGVFMSSRDMPTWHMHDGARSIALLPQIRYSS